MTNLTPPPMLPSVEERAESLRYCDTSSSRIEKATELQKYVYRDGFAAGVQAERARIVDALRHTSDKQLWVICNVAKTTDGHTVFYSNDVSETLYALADWMEAQSPPALAPRVHGNPFADDNEKI